MMALWGFWAREVGEPSLVGISITIWPVDVSVYLRYPALPTVASRKWNGRNSMFVTSMCF